MSRLDVIFIDDVNDMQWSHVYLYIFYVSIHLYIFIFEFCFDFVGDVAKCGHSVSAVFGRFSLRLWEPLARRGLFVWAIDFPCPPFFD